MLSSCASENHKWEARWKASCQNDSFLLLPSPWRTIRTVVPGRRSAQRLSRWWWACLSPAQWQQQVKQAEVFPADESEVRHENHRLFMQNVLDIIIWYHLWLLQSVLLRGLTLHFGRNVTISSSWPTAPPGTWGFCSHAVAWPSSPWSSSCSDPPPFSLFYFFLLQIVCFVRFSPGFFL